MSEFEFSKSPKAAFTLIELLVVVAVIAILAAIAVPNFLEAQVRSKVSRAKSDMRTLTLGIESYRIDTNKYPPDFQFGVVPFIDRLSAMTTPISYVSSLPRDPFAERGRVLEYVASRGVNGYGPENDLNQLYFPLTYDYANRIQPDGTFEDFGTWINITRVPNTALWAMRSAGPDLTPTYLGTPEASYDPTNGTVSTGNIYWTGPGVGEDGPLTS